jgi:hypothetical protein
LSQVFICAWSGGRFRLLVVGHWGVGLPVATEPLEEASLSLVAAQSFAAFEAAAFAAAS